MSPQKPVFGLVDFGRKERRSPMVGVQPFHKAPMRFPDFRLTGSGRKPKNLVGLLIGHGSRARRSALPRCAIRLEVFTPSGHPAIKISFE